MELDELIAESSMTPEELLKWARGRSKELIQEALRDAEGGGLGEILDGGAPASKTPSIPPPPPKRPAEVERAVNEAVEEKIPRQLISVDVAGEQRAANESGLSEVEEVAEEEVAQVQNQADEQAEEILSLDDDETEFDIELEEEEPVPSEVLEDGSLDIDLSISPELGANFEPDADLTMDAPQEAASEKLEEEIEDVDIEELEMVELDDDELEIVEDDEDE